MDQNKWPEDDKTITMDDLLTVPEEEMPASPAEAPAPAAEVPVEAPVPEAPVPEAPIAAEEPAPVYIPVTAPEPPIAPAPAVENPAPVVGNPVPVSENPAAFAEIPGITPEKAAVVEELFPPVATHFKKRKTALTPKGRTLRKACGSPWFLVTALLLLAMIAASITSCFFWPEDLNKQLPRIAESLSNKLNDLRAPIDDVAGKTEDCLKDARSNLDQVDDLYKTLEKHRDIKDIDKLLKNRFDTDRFSDTLDNAEKLIGDTKKYSDSLAEKIMDPVNKFAKSIAENDKPYNRTVACLSTAAISLPALLLAIGLVLLFIVTKTKKVTGHGALVYLTVLVIINLVLASILLAALIGGLIFLATQIAVIEALKTADALPLLLGGGVLAASLLALLILAVLFHVRLLGTLSLARKATAGEDVTKKVPVLPSRLCVFFATLRILFAVGLVCLTAALSFGLNYLDMSGTGVFISTALIAGANLLGAFAWIFAGHGLRSVREKLLTASVPNEK